VAGNFDLVDTIYAARGPKPIWAVLDEGAYSAAYSIASTEDRVLVPRTGGAGSIGIVVIHVDLSGALSKAGLKVNIIQFGARKYEGNEFQALPPDVRARFQARMNELGELFVNTVAPNRNIDAADIIEAEAACLTANEALALGLVDEIASADAAFEKLLATL